MSTPSNSTLVRKRLLLSGLVQGVGFRWFVKNLTEGLDLTGFVQNLSTGEVEIEVQGAPDLVEDFARMAQKGPKYARVDRVDAKDLPPLEVERGFEIR